MRPTLFALATLAALAFAPSGQAATITIGSPLSADFSLAVINFAGPETVANVILPEPGAQVSSPVEGTIVRWRMLDSKGGPFRLRVLSRNADGTYTAVATSAPQTVATTALESFPTNLPIKAGQTIGLDNTHAGVEEDVLAASVSPAAGFGVWNPALPDGSTRAPKVFTGSEGEEPLGAELAFNAEVVPRPVVDLISPADGPISGGSAVSIAGHDLGGATSVKFGGAAASFSVLSESLITAVSPPGAIGGVDIAVTTAGGTSAPVGASRFTYRACVVPKLTGKKLKAGRRRLAAADCKLGKVSGKGRKVIAQRPKPGIVLDPGAKVRVRLGPSPHHR
jgi:hypothetical protein